jgi:hypothetical protein
MTLFETPSQFREKAAICRIFELLPLQSPLAEGHVFRWFALNIPMDLGTGGSFTSDMDIIACLCPLPKYVSGPSYPPHSDGYIYKTWEVKVSLLAKDGTPRSLKSGKTASTIRQLKASARSSSITLPAMSFPFSDDEGSRFCLCRFLQVTLYETDGGTYPRVFYGLGSLLSFVL